MDIQQLISQFLGGQASNEANNGNQNASNSSDETTVADKAKNIFAQATQGGMGGFAGGALAGGLLTLLFSNSKVRDIATGAASIGGAAVLGAMAYKAYQGYQAGKTPTEGATLTELDISKVDSAFIKATAVSANGNPFSLTLIKGMIMAAKSDGQIDQEEQRYILKEIEKFKLSAEEKSMMLDVFTQENDMAALVAEVDNQQQAAELYLVSRLAITLDQVKEEKYLSNLASALKMPPDLVSHLERQVQLCKPA